MVDSLVELKVYIQIKNFIKYTFEYTFFSK